MGNATSGLRLNKRGDRRGMLTPVGEDSPWWNNSEVYRSVHRWVRRHKPRSDHCEECGATNVKLDIASKTCEYSRDFSEYRWLCRACHMKSDGRLDNLKQGASAITTTQMQLADGIKICSVCEQPKAIANFAKNKYRKSGIQSYCSDCAKKTCKKQYYLRKERTGVAR